MIIVGFPSFVFHVLSLVAFASPNPSTKQKPTILTINNYYNIDIFTGGRGVQVELLTNTGNGQNETRPVDEKAKLLMLEKAAVDKLNAIQLDWTAVVHEVFAYMNETAKKRLMGGLLEYLREIHDQQQKHIPSSLNSTSVTVLGPKQQHTAAPLVRHKRQQLRIKRQLDSLPKEFDARQKWPGCADIIGSVPDQGDCGACWAVSSAAVLTDRICIARLKNGLGTVSSDPSAYVSAQDTLSCVQKSKGCDGGAGKYAWDWFATSGVVTGTNQSMNSGCKPYLFPPAGQTIYAGSIDVSCVQNCQWQWPYSYPGDKRFVVQPLTHWWGKAPDRELNMMQEIMQNGPIQVTVEVYDDFLRYGQNPLPGFQSRSNVYYRVSPKKVGNHLMKLIGWGETTDAGGQLMKYWLGVNSWNYWWGLDGLFKWRRGTDECSIESMSIDFGTPKV